MGAGDAMMVMAVDLSEEMMSEMKPEAMADTELR